MVVDAGDGDGRTGSLFVSRDLNFVFRVEFSAAICCPLQGSLIENADRDN